MRTQQIVVFTIYLSILLMALPCFFHRARAEEQSGIVLRCDDNRRIGAGVLVKDFRPWNEGGVLLLTALHVVNGCSSVEPLLVNCRIPKSRKTSPIDISPILPSPWDSIHPVELITWPRFDLAAFVIPAAERERFTKLLKPYLLAVKLKSDIPPYLADLEIRARGGINVCPSIPARRRDRMTAYDLFLSMDNESDRIKVFGSLGDEAQLLSYESSAQNGTSGGPVMWINDSQDLWIAIHLGGKEGVLQWGVLVGVEMLLLDLMTGDTITIRLDERHTRIKAKGFREPGLINSNKNQAAKIDIGINRDSLSVMMEAGTPIDPFGAVSISPQLSWTRLWFSPGFAPLDTAFGTRALLGGIFGLYRSPVFDLDSSDETIINIEDPLSGSAQLPFVGVLAEVDAEFYFARMLPVNYVVSLGLRAGISHQDYVVPEQYTFVWGPVFAARARWRWTDQLSGLLQLNVSYQRIPVAATTRDCTGWSQPRPSVWDLWGSTALGVEFRL